MKKILYFVCLTFTGLGLRAQSPILTEVKIEFEKKVNAWASLPPDFADQMKQRIPQYSTSFYNYETDGNKSLYKIIPSANKNDRGFFGRQENEDQAVYTDFKTESQVSLKSVFEKTYLIADSIGKIQWKITSDFREIAGFNCRRATTVIMDSVFVVAFYTNEIVAPGGPESFGGLPGTILGLVINRVHTTWYATKVSVVDVNPAAIVAPVAPKAEKITKEKLIESLQSRFQGNTGRGGFGNMRDRVIWDILM